MPFPCGGQVVVLKRILQMFTSHDDMWFMKKLREERKLLSVK